jgi:serine protease Do
LQNQFFKVKHLSLILSFCLLITALPGALIAVQPPNVSRETPVVRAVRVVSPAVVNLSSEEKSTPRDNPFSAFGSDPFFDSFFRDFFDHRPRRSTRERFNLGSGVIIDGKRAIVITNAHVIANTEVIYASLLDERTFRAQVVGADPESDIAVLRLDTKEQLPAVDMATTADLMIGETVIAIGNPFGFSHTVTTGVISALNRSIRAGNRVYKEFIQTDASINPGNSGGPLLNINGELIGINTAIYAKAQGIGFAIPIERARKTIFDLIEYGEVQKAWVGMELQDLDPALAEYLGVPTVQGALVSRIEKDSPAAKAGIAEGDILLAIDEKSVSSRETYLDILSRLSPGEPIICRFQRRSKQLHKRIVPTLFPLEKAVAFAWRQYGITVADISSEHKRRYPIRTTAGVLIEQIANRSELARMGVEPGDVVRQINDTKISGLEAFWKAVVKYRNRKSVVLLVQRGARGYYLTIGIQHHYPWPDKS